VLEALGKFILGILFASYAISKGYHLSVVAAYALVGLTLGVFAGTLYIVFHKLFFKAEQFDAEFVPDDTAPIRSVKQIFKTLFVIAIPISISASVTSVSDVIDSVVILRTLQSIGYTEPMARTLYGNYTTLCVSLYNLPPVLIYPIAYSIVPYISSAIAEKNMERAREAMTSSLKIASLLAIPSALGLSALSKPILGLLFSNKESVELAAPLLSVLAIAVFFVGMLAITNSILQANRLERMPIISMVTGAVVKTCSTFILMKLGLEMYGAPLGTVLCYMTICILNFIFISKKVGVVPDFKRIFIRPFLASIPCVLTALGVYFIFSGFHEKLATLIALFCAVLVYGIAVFIFKAITKEEILMIPKGKKIYGLLHKIKLI